MSRIPVWKQLSMKGLNQKDLQRAIRSLRRCNKSMTKSERESEEWALTIQCVNNMGYL